MQMGGWQMSSLSHMKEGEHAVVQDLTAVGPIRRRLQDLGIIPGTKIECVQKSPLGDPVAYMVRGAVIALRREDADTVRILEAT